MELPGLGELLQRNYDGFGVAGVRMTARDWRTVSLELLAKGQHVLHSCEGTRDWAVRKTLITKL